MRAIVKFGLLGLLAACGGDKDESTTTDVGGDDDDDNTTTTPTGPTGDPSGTFAAEARFRGLIAWDAGTQSVVSPIIDGDTDFISAFIIELGEEGWTDADPNSTCEIVINIEGLGASTDALAEGFLWGMDIPEGLDAKTTYTDCVDKGFDPSQFVKGDPLQDWGALDWRLRMGGTMDADLVDWLTPDTTTGDFDIAEYVNGALYTDGGGISDEDDTFWYGYLMDAAGNVDFDSRLLDTMMVPAGQLATGYYVIDQSVYWILEPDE